MMLGLGLSICNPQRSAEVFDPATLPLTGWWRGSFVESPWEGTASEGDSGTHDLTEATNPPSAGTAVNGFDPAAFDGSNDILGNADAMSSLVTASAYFVWALVNVDAINTGNANVFDNDAIFVDGNAVFGIHLTSSGGNKAQFYHFDGAQKKVEIAISTGQYALLMQRYDGTNIRARVNSGSVQTAAAGNIVSLSPNFFVGRNYDGSAFFDGALVELGFIDSAQTDARFDDITNYVNARYALSL